MKTSTIFRIFWTVYVSLTVFFGFLTYKIFYLSNIPELQYVGLLPIIVLGGLLVLFYVGVYNHFNGKKYYPFDKLDLYIKSSIITSSELTPEE